MWKDNFEVIDFHSHILAGVDDGAPDLQTSLDMLSALSDMGVDKVVSTSHYYNSVETISSFISRRDEALYKLERHIYARNNPRLRSQNIFRPMAGSGFIKAVHWQFKMYSSRDAI